MSPDGSRKPLPEERLLKLIRAKVPNTSASGSADVGGAGATSIAWRDASASSLRWPVFASGALGAILVVEAVYLMVQLGRPAPSVEIPQVKSSAPSEPGKASAALMDVPSLAASASSALFTSPAAPTAPNIDLAKPHESPSAAAKLLAARLTLMGIMAGESAQAIIEDSQTKKTYFVTKGQTIAEGAVVEQVLDNRVILSLDGEKIELTL